MAAALRGPSATSSRRALGALPSQDLVARGGVAKGALIAGQRGAGRDGAHRQSTSHAHMRMHAAANEWLRAIESEKWVDRMLG